MLARLLHKSSAHSHLRLLQSSSSKRFLTTNADDNNTKRCVIFPGQGAQYVGMGKDIYDEFPYIKEMYQECDEALGYKLSNLMFEGPLTDLTETINAQPAVLIHSLSLCKMLEQEQGITMNNKYPIAMGLSLGEYSALAVNGCFESLSDVLYTVQKRAQFMHECCMAQTESGNYQQKMLAILHDGTLKCEDIQTMMDGIMSEKNDGSNTEFVANVSNYNSSKQIVVSGHKGILDILQSNFKKQKVRSKYINTAGSFHSSLMSSGKMKLENELKSITVNLPKNDTVVVSNVKSIATDELESGEDIKRLLCEQVCSTVNWYPSVLKCIQEYGVTDFTEIGPKPSLSGMVKDICSAHNIENISIQNFDKLSEGFRAN